MISTRKALALLGILIMVVAFSACRTRTTKKNTPTTGPTDTAPTVDLNPPTATTVESHDNDFVKDPGVKEEELPASLDALNQMLQERGLVRDAFFEFDASTLSTDAQEALTTSASWLKAHPAYTLLIEGHCDERGTEQYNLALGDRRANTAKDYLVTLGVDGGRIKTVSYGEERPFDQGHDESGWQKNRRAHLVVTGK